MKKAPEKITRVGLVANTNKQSTRSIVEKAAELCARAGREVLSDDATARLARIKSKTFSDGAHLARQCDLLLVFGGDGTMLRVVREIDGARTPILGVNAGRLGFLTAVPARNLPKALQQIWAGDYFIESRPLIEGTISSLGKRVAECALNDIVISRGAVSRMIELDVRVGGQEVTRYRCDGLIVSSPTGSTAYSLSAGGAIISPDANVFAITPICPHTLSNRSVIVSLNSVIEVKVLSETVETTMTVDGQVQNHLVFGDVVAIRRSRRVVRLLHPAGDAFFDTVRRKLHWSGSNV